MDKLDSTGFSDWFRHRLDEEKAASYELARVIAVHKGRYTVHDGETELDAELSGNLLYRTDSPVERPTVGDWVYADFYDSRTHAIIHGVLPRRTLLKRKTAGKQVDLQLIAANIDAAFIMQSADYNYNLRRLERYLAMVNEGGIAPIILLSKSDLIGHDETAGLLKNIAEIAPRARVLAFSNLSGANISAIKDTLEPGHTYCLLGSSGVGKTTLLNNLLGSEAYQTRSVSKIKGKGRHTTTRRELISLENGAMLIDTPGMRELGNLSVDSGIDETFAEIIELSARCKFSDCTHTSEKGCAILEAMKAGSLSEERYQNYMKMRRESAFNELSYTEKRKKDRDFGKMVRSVIKGKQH